MNKHCRFILVVLAFWLSPSFANTLDNSVISKITLEASDTDASLANNPFSDVVKHNLVRTISNQIDQGVSPTLFDKSQSWSALSGDSKGTHLLRFSISADQYAKGKLSITGAKSSSLYVNQILVKGANEYSLNLMNQDYRALLVVSGVEQWQDFSIEWKESADASASSLSFLNDQSNKRASMRQYYDSETVGTLNLSPNGELLVWSRRSYSDVNGDKPTSVVEILDLDSQEVVYRWQGMSPSQVTWREDSQALVFMHANTMHMLSVDNWRLSKLAENVKGIRGINWLGNSQLLLSWHESEKAPSTITKRYRALQDRWSYWRGNQQLHLFDIASGLFKQVTQNSLSTALADLDVKNKQALIVRSPIDYKEPPHSLSQLYRLDIASGEETLIGEYRTLGSAQFHNKGIVITAGPSFNDSQGSVLASNVIPNNYDGQLYMMSNDGEVSALSRDFRPAINRAEVLNNGDMLLSTVDQDMTQLYLYDLSREKFTKVDTKVEVVSGFSVSTQNKTTLVYKGSSATQPESVHARKLSSRKDKVLFDAKANDFRNIEFASLKDWDYTTKDGQFIDGRVYYPPNFDANKKYPALIYYYGGTTPVQRAFTGRWPFSLWASHGYIVYVLQPSGTIGYGQEFSARHVNAWGINTADEIIESTKAFVDAHSFVDKDRLGNLGASYGGFMTMYLATKTDMFAASISHAGISNLTSYWGYGWWGYGYSGIATTGSFPWNRTDLYIEQSPVYDADKVTTSILLVHGDADTNVPVAESHQMYTALKLLDKDVELIEFLGDDHHINSRERRLIWWETKLAYFDMKLKDQPTWWHELYLKDLPAD